jgi:hypothetical protein
MDAGIFFLSRWRHNTLIFDPTTLRRIALDVLLRKHHTLDREVLLGDQERLAVRLVATPVPAAVANSRRRKARQKMKRDRRYNPNAQAMFFMGWNIFITNVSRDVWKTEELRPIYRLRWQIEMMFKAWKSQLRLAELNYASERLLRLSVMTKLLFCALTHNTCASIEMLTTDDVHVSLLRLARILSDSALLIAAIVLDMPPSAFLSYLIASHAFYEHRSDRRCFPQAVADLALG